MHFFSATFYSRGLKFLQFIYESFDWDLTRGFLVHNFNKFSKFVKNKSVALQLRRAKTDWSGYCQMAVQVALRLAKRYPSTLISVFVIGFRYFSYQVSNQLSSRGWGDPVPDAILPEKILGYSRDSNPGTSWMAVRRANRYTKQAVWVSINFIYCLVVYTRWRFPCFPEWFI